MSDLPTLRDLAPLGLLVVLALLARPLAAWMRRSEDQESAEAVERARRWALRRGLEDRGGEQEAGVYGGSFASFVRETPDAVIRVTLRRQSGRHEPRSVLVSVSPRRGLGGGVVIGPAGSGEIPATPSGDSSFDAVCAVYVHDAQSARGLDAEGRRRIAEFFARARDLRLRRAQMSSGEMSAAYGFGPGASAFWVDIDVPESLLDTAVAACAALACVRGPA